MRTEDPLSKKYNINAEYTIASAFDSLLSKEDAKKILGGFKEAFE
jgi:hypothetical protein